MADEIVINVRATDSFSGVLGNFGNIITGIKSALDIAGDAFRAFTGFAMEGLDAIASYERMAASFETLIAKELLMTGAATDMAAALAMSGEKAEELLRWNQELAINSPFTAEGVADALRMAMAYGFTVDEAKRLTEALIDFAAGSGATEYAMTAIARALGQISATGKVTGGDMLQLVNAGLPVVEILAEGFGVTTAKLMEMRTDGLLPATEAIEYITQYLETNFAGAAERQANTWAGLQGTFEDITQMGLREFFGGLFDALQPVAVALSEFLQGPGMDILSFFGDKLRDAMTPMTSAFKFVIDVFNELASIIDGFMISIPKLSSADAIFTLVTNHIPKLGELGDILMSWGDNIPILEDLGEALRVFDFWLAAGMEPGDAFEQFLIRMAKADGPIAVFAQYLLDLKLPFDDINEAMRVWNFWLSAGLTPLEALEQGLLNLSKSDGPLAGFAAEILKVLNGGSVAGMFDTFVGQIFDEIASQIDEWVSGDGPQELSGKIASGIEGAIADIGTGEGFDSKAVTAAGNIFSALDRAVANIEWGDIITAMDTALSTKISEHDWTASGQSFASAITSIFQGAEGEWSDPQSDRWAWIDNMPFAIALRFVQAIFTSNTWATIEDAVSDWFMGAFDPYSDKWNWLDRFGDILLRLLLPVTFFMTVREKLAGVGQAMWDGIIEGLNKIGLEFWTTWVEEHLVAPIKRLLGISSPSTVFKGIGGDIIDGLLDGLKGGWTSVTTWFETKITDLLENLTWENIKAYIAGDMTLSELLGGDGGGGVSLSGHSEGGGLAGGTGTVGGRTGGGGTDGTGGLGQTVNNYFYGPVYFNHSTDDTNYDCPSPNPIISGTTGGRLVTSGLG